MAKLFNLKEWLTIPDTAQHLSIVFDEEVSEADVLQLALDGHLQLSVNFVNHTHALCREQFINEGGKSWNKIWHEFVNARRNIDPFFASSVEGDAKKVGAKVDMIKGIWDFPMISDERLVIENEYHRLTGGPAVDFLSMEGAYVTKPGGAICELLQHSDKYKNGIRELIPARVLPENIILVVRTNALREFENSLSQEEGTQSMPDVLSDSERNSLLKLVLGMAISAYQYDPESKRNTATGDNRGSIADDLARLGLNMESDTVRKFVKEAVEQFGDLILKPDNP